MKNTFIVVSVWSLVASFAMALIVGFAILMTISLWFALALPLVFMAIGFGLAVLIRVCERYE